MINQDVLMMFLFALLIGLFIYVMIKLYSSFKW